MKQKQPHRELSPTGTFLKQARIKAGITQGYVAKKLGYSSPQFISNWERGESVPPIKHLKSLAIYYKIDAELLFDHILKYAIDKVRKQMRREFERSK